ncbi:MAG: DUF1016 N-terminal domain-containing protein [bacterium]|nr:DUF1016 N-terminal domain-containing protein [bacterium]
MTTHRQTCPAGHPKEKRAEYGKRIVSSLGRQLELEFGRGFSEKSHRHMVRFAEAFPDEKIVSVQDSSSRVTGIHIVSRIN